MTVRVNPLTYTPRTPPTGVPSPTWPEDRR